MNILAKRKVVLAVIVCLLFGAAFQFFCALTNFSCGSYAEAAVPEKLVVSNAWNHDYALGMQCMVIDVLQRHHFDAAWAWSWANRSETEIPKSSASVAYGFVPWYKASTTKKLPVRMSAIDSAMVHYDFSTYGDGKYETSLKLYLTRTARPTTKDVDAEIIIWLGSSRSKPWADYRGDLQISDRKYGLWVGKIESWKYITLKAEQTPTAGVLDVKPFLAALAKRKEIPGNLYLASIEIGDEITSGRGYTVINSFSVELRP